MTPTPSPCARARDLPLDGFPPGRPLRCARCRAVLRGGEGPALEVWCPGAAAAPEAATLEDPDGAPIVAELPQLGRWRLEERLGHGGAGVVYRAHDTLLDRRVAIKLLSAGAWASPDALARFRREARAAGQLGLPGVVKILDMGTAPGGAPWLAMELIDGPSLAAVRADGPLSAERAARFGLEVARTLAAVHRAGLAHRDVKPSNIVLDPTGRPVLVDFGLVVPLDDTSEHTRAFVGTPAYMAPEQLAGRPVGDWRRVDGFALGRVLAELCPSPPPTLAAIVARATASDPAERYPDLGRLADDLAGFLEGRPIWARPPGPMQRAALFVRRQRRPLGVGLAAALGLALAGIGGDTVRAHRRRADREARELDLHARVTALLPTLDATDAAGEDGDASLAALVEDPTWARTAERARAWAARGRRLLDAGRTDAARESWARAVLAARRPADRQDALLGLAETLAARRDWAALRRTLGEVDRAGVTTDADTLRRRLAEATSDLGAAARYEAPADAAFLGAFGTGTRVLDDGRTFLSTAGPAGGGRDAFYVARYPGGELSVIDAEGARPLGTHAGPCAADTVYLRRSSPAGPRFAAMYPDGEADCGPNPLDVRPWRVGALLLFPTGGYDRRLWMRSFAGGPLRIADPDWDALRSFTLDAQEVDLDGDGEGEVALATGPALGYGVRLYQRTADGLALRARTLLGMATSVRQLGPGLLLVGTTSERPSRRLFGAEQPYGVPTGLHVLRFADERFTTLRSLPNPDASADPARNQSYSVALWAGDADGDGYGDAVALQVGVERGWLGLYRGGPDGALHEWLLDDWRPLAAGQLDDDPAPEILASRGDPVTFTTGSLYVLGLGDTPLPTLELGPEPAVPDEALPELLLARLGLHDNAARALDRRARAEPAPERRAHLLRLAAAQWEEADAPAEAARDRAAAGDQAEARADWISAGDFDEARALGETGPVAALGGPGRMVALVPPDPGWRLVDELVRPNLRTGSLDLTLVGGQASVGELRLRRTGGAARVRVEVQVDRLEWGAGLRILGSIDGSQRPWGLGTHVVGGGGILVNERGAADCGAPVEARGATIHESLVFDVATDGARRWSRVEEGGELLRRCVDTEGDLGAETWRLELLHPDPGLVGTLARASITSLRVWGLAPEPAVDPDAAVTLPAAVAWRLRPGDPALWRDPAAALAGFRAAWESLADGAPDDAELAAALRAIPDPTPHAGDLADARWALVARGRAAWATGDRVAAERDLRAALPALRPEEWAQALAAHATLAEIAQASGEASVAAAEVDAAVAAAPTREAGELHLRSFPRLVDAIH